MNTSEEKEMEKVSGVIEDVVYHNEDNGYTVLLISTENSDEPLTCVGELPFAAVGESISIMGHYENHQTYGRQLKIEYFEKDMPEGVEAMRRYLSSGAVKGVGPATAEKIVDLFGEDTFEVIEKNPSFLAEINGISMKKALAISEDFKAQFGMRQVMLFASRYFGTALAVKIYKEWGPRAEEIIRKNPYILAEKIDGIGFEKADQVAKELGVEDNNPERIEAGIVYILNYHAMGNGHTFIPMDKLLPTVSEMLDVSEEEGEKALEALISKGRVYSIKGGKRQCIYLKEYFEAEKYIGKKIDVLNHSAYLPPIRDITREVEMIESETGLHYAKMQKKAILSALSSGVMILTGGPGTGKTTVIQALIRIYSQMAYRVALAAPTGRAAKRMSEATGEEARTVHRLLEAEFGGREMVFNRNENNQLEEDVLIIDEISMMDTLLFEALLRATKPGAVMILIGDADQLPSVGAGNVLNDLLESEVITTVQLKEIFRQAKESRIVTNAHAINSGEYPTLSDKENDFFFVKREKEEDITPTVVSLWNSRLPKAYGREIMDKIQVISPSKKGSAGTEALNIRLQAVLNPPSPNKVQFQSRGRSFREGDKVMQIKNNYDIPYKRGSVEGKGIFNGDIGLIERISVYDRKLYVRYEDKVAEYDFELAEELDHAYAITVHKSQGSEYPVVILPLYTYAPRLLTRELFYTAVTRAQKMVVLVGQEEAVYKMVENSRRPMRYTGLKSIVKAYAKAGNKAEEKQN